MKKSVLIILLVISYMAEGQVSGFMGKRQAINIGASVSPAFSSSGDIVKGKAVSMQYFLGYEYMIGRKWTTSVNYHFGTFSNNNLDFDNAVEDYFRNGPYEYTVNINSYSISFSRFLSWHSDFIAPVGRFISFGLMTCNYSITDENGNIYTPNTKFAKGSVTGMIFSYGRNRVFFRKILFSTTIESALLFNLTPSKGNPNSESLQKIDKALFYKNIVGIKLSAGYLF